ncbi:MAG TPA: AMP-binding protein, partial [Solirubrobacteraceae bacterium]|nr:AMP-binding protein [Solirubrobacteraceae bacterium]
GMFVEAWLRRAARRRPDAVAIEAPEGNRSYGELYAAARAGADALAERGVAQRERVALALPPGLAFAEAFHACLLRGAVAVPVDLRLATAERARVCAGAALLIEEPLAGPWSGALSDISSAERASARGASAGKVEEEEEEEEEPGERHDLDAVAAVIYTSGTSSEPKPVELTYGNFLWSAFGSAVALGLDPKERWLCALPVSHVGGLSIVVRSAVYATTAVVHERFDTDRVLDGLMAQNVTLVSLVATTLARLLDAGLARPPALRCALTGGGPVPEGLIERAREAGVPVGATYGLTEACSQVTTGGPPLFCTRVRIQEVPGGEPGAGEIMVSGPTVAPASRSLDGWLRTGDLGTLDEHGHLRVTGRLADTIVSGGENVAPAEVEAALESHPGVLEAAVLGRQDPDWGEAVAAIVVVRPDVEISADALRAHCAAKLARYKVPKRIDFRATPLPRTRSGKLLRRELL